MQISNTYKSFVLLTTRLVSQLGFRCWHLFRFGICTVLLFPHLAYSQDFSLAGEWKLVEKAGKVKFAISGQEVTAQIHYDSGSIGDGKGTFDGRELKLNILWHNLRFRDERVNQHLNGRLPAIWHLEVEDNVTLKGERSINRVRWTDSGGELQVEVKEDIRRDPLTLVSLTEPNELRFIDIKGATISGDGLSYGEVFFLQVAYERPPARPPEPVSLAWEGGEATIELYASGSDGTKFVSGPLHYLFDERATLIQGVTP